MKTHYDLAGIGSDISYEYIREICNQLPEQFRTCEFKAYFSYWYKLKNPGSLLHLLKKNEVVQEIKKIPGTNQRLYQVRDIYRNPKKKIMKYSINEAKMMALLSGLKRNGWYISQAEKAEILGLSTSVVNRLETGSKKFGDLKADQFLDFAAAVQVHPIELLKNGEDQE